MQPSLSVEAVPAGRYFVRVRAVNYGGLSAPSDEIVVDVPWAQSLSFKGTRRYGPPYNR